MGVGCLVLEPAGLSFYRQFIEALGDDTFNEGFVLPNRSIHHTETFALGLTLTARLKSFYDFG